MVVNHLQSLLRGKNHRISMIINDHVVRFVETIKPNMIKTYGERRLPFGIIREGNIAERETLLMILEECVENWRIKGARLSFCVPDSSYMIRNTTVPSHVPDDEVKGEVYLDLGEKLHLPFENPILDVSIVGQTNEEKEVIVVASPESVVGEYRTLFEEVKLKPIIADISSLSIYRLFHSMDLANQHDHFLIIQIHLDSINMTIFHKDLPVFTRHIRIFLDEDDWETTINRLGLIIWTFTGDDTQIEEQIHDFSIELERIINFYQFSVHKGQEQVTKLVVTGDHPHLDVYKKKCRESVQIPMIDMPDSLFKTQNDRDIPIRFYEAIGLSMHS